MLGLLGALFLSKESRDLIAVGQTIFNNLDTKEERQEVAEYAVTMFADGKVTVPEWAKFGKKLGILKGKK
jgi:hypothetical protein|tara:strand:- start:210 stop:419 length:210 start_codon:yes stop_codon:yes gene_type:complete